MKVAPLLFVLSIPLSSALAQDIFEDNDTCSAGVPLPIGSSNGLTVESADEDWYEITLAPGETADVSTTAGFTDGEVQFLTAESPCGTTIETAREFGLTPDRIRIGNSTASPRVVSFGALVDPPVASVVYTLDAAVVPAPLCFGGPPDAFEPNDSCVNASLLVAGQMVAGVSELGDEDWFSLNVPGASETTVILSFFDAGADLELAVFGSDCGDFIQNAQTETNNEALLLVNDQAAARTIHLRVRVHKERGVCTPYSLNFYSVPAASSCVLIADDALEPNNSSATATPTGAFSEFQDLYVSDSNHDLFRATVAPGELVRAELEDSGDSLRLSIWAAGAPIGSDEGALLDRGIAGSGSVRAAWRNEGATVQDVYLRVGYENRGVGECVLGYDLRVRTEVDPCSQPNDVYAPNQTCQAPFLLTAFPFVETAALVRANEPDWFAIDLDPGEAVHFLMLYDNTLGHLHLAEFEGCTEWSIQPSNGGFHEYMRKNTSAFTRRFSYKIDPWLLSPGEPCQSYELYVDRYQGDAGNPASLCFGDGSGSACPCGNESAAGSGGGCLHGSGSSGRLQLDGGPSLAAAHFELTVQGASANSFALLISGVNLLPAPSPGEGLPSAGNGLRCVGGDFRRHGTRATDASGDGITSWGSDLLGITGFQPGETRTFQAFFRELGGGACASNVNTTQAVRVTARP